MDLRGPCPVHGSILTERREEVDRAVRLQVAPLVNLRINTSHWKAGKEMIGKDASHGCASKSPDHTPPRPPGRTHRLSGVDEDGVEGVTLDAHLDLVSVLVVHQSFVEGPPRAGLAHFTQVRGRGLAASQGGKMDVYGTFFSQLLD